MTKQLSKVINQWMYSENLHPDALVLQAWKQKAERLELELKKTRRQNQYLRTAIRNMSQPARLPAVITDSRLKSLNTVQNSLFKDTPESSAYGGITRCDPMAGLLTVPQGNAWWNASVIHVKNGSQEGSQKPKSDISSAVDGSALEPEQ